MWAAMLAPMPGAGPPWVVVLARQRESGPDDDAPASSYVFDFIGRACVIEGMVSAGRFSPHGQAFGFDAAGVADGPARMYLRPHDAQTGAAGEGLEARVSAVHPHAGRITLELALAGQERALEVDLVATPGTQVPALGAVTGLQLPRYRVYPR